jgi:hypothetical protein
MSQTLVVTLDVTDTTEAQLQETLSHLFNTPGGRDRLNLKYNLVDIDQEVVIAAENALIDILEHDRRKERGE